MGPVPRIVVVEDDQRIARLLCAQIAELGYEAAGTAVSIQQAEHVIDEQRPDLVLMDIELEGDVSGLDGADRIRERFGVPVIFVSAHLPPEALDGRRGGFPHVPKPIDRDRLAIALQTALAIGTGLRWERTQAEIAIALSTQGDLDNALERCTAAVVRGLDAVAADVWTLSDDGQDLVRVTGSGLVPPDTLLRIPIGFSGLGHIARSGRVHVSSDPPDDLELDARAWLEDAGISGFVACPLVVEGRLVGLFAALFRTAVEDRLARVLGAIADVIALGVLRKQLEHDLRQANVDLESRIRDRTAELFDANKKLEERARELATSNAELERFAYVASHDLQEPLRVVTSFVQLLARRYEDKLDADAQRFIGHAVKGVARMQALINDLLTLSRVGSRPIEMRPVGLDQVFREAVENLQQAIQESEAKVTSDRLPVAHGVAEQLVQVVQNLIANGINFRKAIGPRIHVDAVERDGEVEVRVADDGIGIDPQFFDRIFVIFQRLHGPGKYPGTGIGLAICKKVVERHGGRIWVTSAPDVGTTVHFTLPQAG